MALHHVTVSAPEATPDRRMLVLHGILGQGLNWRTVARRLTAARPGWELVLVDLRAHGQSRDVAPPDDLAAAARDLHPLLDAPGAPVRAILGHSFGGKVALELVRQRPEALRRLFMVDSLPGARPERRGSEGTQRVIDMLRELPDRFEDRDDFVAHVKAQGHGSTLGRWLAQSLDRLDDGAYRFGLDMARIGALLDDYFERDLWPALDPPPEELVAHLVIADRSTVWGTEDREHAVSLARAYPDRVRVHVLEKADHWVHVDDPDGLHAILEEGLS